MIFGRRAFFAVRVSHIVCCVSEFLILIEPHVGVGCQNETERDV